MMKDGMMATPDSTEEESSPFQNMQTELHSKGTVLTKAWSDLFSFITKYQGELTVKENAVQIAEKELEVRKKQLAEMRPIMDSSNEEVEKLKDEIQIKERNFKVSQSELSIKEQMLKQVQSDLNCNMEILEKSRCELIEKQSELVRNRGDLERLKSELAIKQEQIQIKDNLLKKMQTEMMRENVELKEKLDLERQALELERRSHETTRRVLDDCRGKLKTSGPGRKVIEIPDSPPTLDLSAEHFGLSNIISMTESQASHSQSMDQEVYSGMRGAQSDTAGALSRMAAMTGESLSSAPPFSQTSTSSHLRSQKRTASPSISTSSPRHKNPRQSSPSFSQSLPQHDNYPGASPSSAMSANRSDVYFPLSVTQEEEKHQTDTANMIFADTDMKIPGQIPGAMPGTPSSGTSDSNQAMPVPISGPIPTGAMSPGGGFGMQPGSSLEGPDKKADFLTLPELIGESGAPGGLVCRFCGANFGKSRWLYEYHLRKHTGVKPYTCEVCQKSFDVKGNLKAHMRIHTGEMPYQCVICQRRFRHSCNLKVHMRGVHSDVLDKLSGLQ